MKDKVSTGSHYWHRTLSLVFLKMFWTAVWRKTQDSCSWHYVCKTIYMCSRKVAVTAFTEMCSASFFMEIKCRQINIVKKKYIQRRKCIVNEIQWELTKKIFFLEIWKLNDVWPLKKNSVIFLRLLKFLKLKKNSITALRLLKLLMLKKDSITFLRLLKFLILF